MPMALPVEELSLGVLHAVVLVVVEHVWGGGSGQDHGSRGRPDRGRGRTCLLVILGRFHQDVVSVVCRVCVQGRPRHGSAGPDIVGHGL